MSDTHRYVIHICCVHTTGEMCVCVYGAGVQGIMHCYESEIQAVSVEPGTAHPSERHVKTCGYVLCAHDTS